MERKPPRLRTRTVRARNTALAVALAVAASSLAMLASPAGTARAEGIHRCTAPDGTTLYTDRPCNAHGARADAMPAALVARLADASQAESAAGGYPAGYAGSGYVDASLPLHPARPAGVARRSPAAGCARSPTQLAMDLQGAFALGDVNRIAESFHWVGMSHDDATAVMQRLERLARGTLVDTRYYDATIVSSGIGTWADAGAAATGAANGVMQLTLGGEGGQGALDLDVQRHEGCYFVRF